MEELYPLLVKVAVAVYTAGLVVRTTKTMMTR